MREVFQPSVDQLSLSAVLNALGDPTRLQILKKLACGAEKNCSYCQLDLPKSAMSHHFKVLREAGLIHVRIEGKQRFLSIRYDDLETRFPGLLRAVINSI